MRGGRAAPAPTEVDGRTLRCSARLVVWHEFDGGDDDPDADRWRKSEPVEVEATLQTPTAIGVVDSAGRAEFAAALAAVGAVGMACEFHAEIELGKDGPELVVTLVNVSPEELAGLGHQRLRGEPRGRRRRDRARSPSTTCPTRSATTAPSLPTA